MPKPLVNVPADSDTEVNEVASTALAAVTII
jgi:hypothetical protein